jgi:hypothetical protein
MAKSGNTSATVTSSIRNEPEQAQVMYNNIQKYGTGYNYKLYGSGGDKVVDTYTNTKDMLGALKSLGIPVNYEKNIIQGAMEGTIRSVGLPNVTNHGADQQALNVLDISARSIKYPLLFNSYLNSDTNVGRALTPYTKNNTDPAFHVEVPQNH